MRMTGPQLLAIIRNHCRAHTPTGSANTSPRALHILFPLPAMLFHLSVTGFIQVSAQTWPRPRDLS